MAASICPIATTRPKPVEYHWGMSEAIQSVAASDMVNA